MAQDKPTDEILPVRDGLVATGGDPGDIQLLGSKCRQCGEVSIGTNSVCLNCGGDQIDSTELSPEGELWTYTVIRHKPPGDYLGPDPFVPFALGLVELADGVRIMAPLEGDVESFEIGSKLRLVPWMLEAGDGQAYKAFRFAPETS
jgi:uncharacterized OB-fold protein